MAISKRYLLDLYYESELQFRYYAILSDKYKKTKRRINYVIGFLCFVELCLIGSNLANLMDLSTLIFIISFVGTLPGFLINLKTIDNSLVVTNADIMWNQARREYETLYNRLLDGEEIKMAEVTRIRNLLAYSEICTANIAQDDKSLEKAIKETNETLKKHLQND